MGVNIFHTLKALNSLICETKTLNSWKVLISWLIQLKGVKLHLNCGLINQIKGEDIIVFDGVIPDDSYVYQGYKNEIKWDFELMTLVFYTFLKSNSS